MKFSMTGQEKGDLLIQMTTSYRCTVYGDVKKVESPLFYLYLAHLQVFHNHFIPLY
jgi:hypothetical protein